MAMKTYQGSCHCGAVRFEAIFDMRDGTSKCNCTLCTKQRAWFVFVKPPNFRLLSDEAGLADYQFGERILHHQFCRTCGVRAFGWGDHEIMGGLWHYVNVASLDNADTTELAEAPVKYVDGRHDDYDGPPPTETRHL